ncbi:MAG: hypothetical protein AB7E49_07940 [Campylobacterales bacterium]
MPPKNLSDKNWESLRINFILLCCAALLALLAYGYYELSPSYTASRQAKALYDRGDYDGALALADEIQKRHPYNIMAFMVYEQSKKALRWKRFIDSASGYWKRVDEISRAKTLDSADLITVRMMAEAVLYDYAKLGDPGILMEQSLIEEADYYHRQFAALYQELFARTQKPLSGLSGADSRAR